MALVIEGGVETGEVAMVTEAGEGKKDAHQYVHVNKFHAGGSESEGRMAADISIAVCEFDV